MRERENGVWRVLLLLDVNKYINIYVCVLGEMYNNKKKMNKHTVNLNYGIRRTAFAAAARRRCGGR